MARQVVSCLAYSAGAMNGVAVELAMPDIIAARPTIRFLVLMGG